MTDIEQKALAQAVAAAGRRMQDYAIMAEENVLRQSIEAHARAIEQHEAFRQEVSDALKGQFIGGIPDKVARFILPKPDPLAEALREALTRRHIVHSDEVMADEAAWLREALAKHGLQVTEIER